MVQEPTGRPAPQPVPESGPASGRESEPGGGSPGWALVTGASTGIGKELALLAAADGRDLVLVARNAGRLEALAARLREEHRVQAVPVPLDLTEAGAPERLHRAARERGIEVDFLMNNAGFGHSRPFPEVPLRLQRAMIALNLSALADLCRLFLPEMLRRGRGRILNVGSGAGYVPGLGFTAYAATKAFVLHLTEGIAAEVAGSGVSVSVLCPGPVDTPFLGTAGIRQLSGVRRWALADPRRVARAGYRGALRGRVVINPGFLPRLVPWTVRLLPRAAVRRLGRGVGREMARRTGRGNAS